MHSTLSWCTVRCLDVLHSVLMHCTLSWCTVLCLDALHSVLMHCTLSWCTVRCLDVLHSVLMHCTKSLWNRRKTYALWCTALCQDALSWCSQFTYAQTHAHTHTGDVCGATRWQVSIYTCVYVHIAAIYTLQVSLDIISRGRWQLVMMSHTEWCHTHHEPS